LSVKELYNKRVVSQTIKAIHQMPKSAADLSRVRALFFPSLAKMIEDVFEQRRALYADKSTPLADQVYDFYSRESPGVEKMDSKRLDSFLNHIGKLEDTVRKLKVSSGYKGVYAQVNPQYAKAHSMSDKVPFGQWNKVDRSELWVAFYPFNLLAELQGVDRSNYPGAESIEKRVYIHVNSPIEKHGMKIAKFLIGQFEDNYGFSYFKMVGPGAANRFDTIVAYCDHSVAARTLIGNLAENKTLNSALAGGTSPGVKELSCCPGVGYADNVGSSYGDTLSQCVASGLERLRAEENTTPNLPKEHLQCLLFESAKDAMDGKKMSLQSPYLFFRVQ
jgi:hypothetical protein